MAGGGGKTVTRLTLTDADCLPAKCTSLTQARGIDEAQGGWQLLGSLPGRGRARI